MIDGIIKADGTSRLMRATLPVTYEEFKAQAASGTLPIDLLFNASGWSQMPTFLNKANLLNDEIASVFGMDVAAVPNDVFAFLGKYNQHWWSVLHGQAGTGYKENRTAITKDVAIVKNGRRTISYAKSVTVNQSSGAVSLSNPQTIEMNSLSSSAAQNSCSSLAALLPVYITGLYDNSDKIYYLPANSTWGNTGYTYHGKTFGYWYDGDGDYYLELAGEYANVYAQEVSSQIYNIPAGETTYEHSTDRNAYPDSGTVDGLTYQYLGIPFQNAVTAPKIATGSYTGTGQYGSANKNRLTFNFEPKMLILLRGSVTESDYDSTTVIVTRERTQVTINTTIHTTGYAITALTNVFDFSDTTITWYMSDSVSSGADIYHGQFNESGKPYYYIAIG